MPAKRLPSLTSLRVFETVARTLSFTRAAEELGVTQAAVSRQIKALETELAVKLLHRGSPRNTLTDAGEQLFGGVYNAFVSIAQSVERITGSGGREILNVSVAPFFSAYWLTPCLMSFVAGHPDIDLRLHHSYHPADYRREGIDIGINWGAGDWPGVSKDKVLDGSLVPVVSPDFLRRFGPFTGPASFFELPLFFEFELGHWRRWFEAAQVTPPARINSLRLNDSHALRRAALDGHCVALLFADLLKDDLEVGRLIAPFATTVHAGFDYFLNYPGDVDLPRKGKLFRRWVLDQRGS